MHPRTPVIRTLLALAVLISAAAPAGAAAGAAAAESGQSRVAAPSADYTADLARSAGALEILREVGGRAPGTGRTTTRADGMPPVRPISFRNTAGPVSPPQDVREELRLPCGEHPPYFPTAPPVTS